LVKALTNKFTNTFISIKHKHAKNKIFVIIMILQQYPHKGPDTKKRVGTIFKLQSRSNAARKYYFIIKQKRENIRAAR
jgi:hypothetical protein